MGRRKTNNRKNYYIKKKLTYNECKFIEVLLLDTQVDLLKKFAHKKIKEKDFNELSDIIYSISLKLSFLYKDCYHENEVE